jgi:hypothetical protein
MLLQPLEFDLSKNCKEICHFSVRSEVVHLHREKDLYIPYDGIKMEVTDQFLAPKALTYGMNRW